jgi:spermidine/putrescine transport system ATP-binding protein
MTTFDRRNEGVTITKPIAWAIEAEGLDKRYGDIRAVRQVSLGIHKGEFFSLLGPSGCGKSTLLRLIAGLDLPDAGTLRIGGRDALAIPTHRRPVNTVFQSYALFPHLSVRDNIAFGLKMKKLPAAQIKERVNRIMGVVAIEDLAERRPAQISGGQKQRVALARAVVNEPEVLLLDEPLGALDLKLRKQLQVELHQLQRRLGITFIHVTHDQDEALVMSDRIAVMNGGKIEQLDTGKRLYEQPRTRFVAQFLGSCNLFSGPVARASSSNATIKTEVGFLTLSLANHSRELAVGEIVSLALRPEKLHLAHEAPSGCGNILRANVQAVIYSGAETQYRLDSGKFPLQATVLNARVGHQGFQEGDAVFCAVAEEALTLLEEA